MREYFGLTVFWLIIGPFFLPAFFLLWLIALPAKPVDYWRKVFTLEWLSSR